MTKARRKTLRQEIGMVFQGGALFDSMTVAENIRFPLEMFAAMTEQEKDERVKFVMDRVRLEGAADKFPSEISGGMQKRVAIGRAISMNPKYLFCDEPNSGLDPETAIVIDQLIQELTHEFNMTTIVNTHDMNSVLEIGDHVVFM
jgi:phospholipid/cholesterol/gamma-HCH transport system ATP-binding protein